MIGLRSPFAPCAYLTMKTPTPLKESSLKGADVLMSGSLAE
jgi:hypothetical protein